MKRFSHGFTIIELLVVLPIIDNKWQQAYNAGNIEVI